MLSAICVLVCEMRLLSTLLDLVSSLNASLRLLTQSTNPSMAGMLGKAAVNTIARDAGMEAASPHPRFRLLLGVIVGNRLAAPPLAETCQNPKVVRPHPPREGAWRLALDGWREASPTNDLGNVQGWAQPR